MIESSIKKSQEIMSIRLKDKVFPLVTMAYRAKDRFMGLMFKQGLGIGEGLFIPNCNSIHSFFMKFPIDVIFVDKHYQIKKLKRNFPPWKMTPIYFSAKHVFEFPAHSIPKEMTEGDFVEVICLK